VKSEVQLSSAEKLFKLCGLILLIALFCSPLASAPDPAEAEFKSLQKLSASKNKEAFDKESILFLKKYPGSSRVPDVRLLIADNENDIDLALNKYRIVIKNYSRFAGREQALFRICQILDLKSKWKELKIESSEGIRLFPAGEYINDFRFMHITALIMLEDYSSAKNEAIKITEHTHDFETLSKAIFLLAEVEKKTSGNSRSYIYNLRELAVGFRDSSIYPSIIFKLAQFYDERKEFGKAYSAYSDISELFPDSPEADMAIQRIEKLKPLNPKKTAYMPDAYTVKNTDEIDLSPEYEVSNKKDENYYSVAIGPYTRLNDSAGVIKLLKFYDDIRQVKTAYGYMVYLGRHSDADSALDMRVRLAEEYGINGNIVRFSIHEKKSYIYEDR
jgi:tetratricopeptide (TPR) repeat protein